MSQLIKDIASRHMKRIKRDEEGLVIIPGRLGQSHLFEYSSTIIGVMCLFEHTRRWNMIRELAQVLGIKIIQNGDTEGCLLVNPLEINELEFAFDAIKARKRKQLSEAHRAVLAARMREIHPVGFKGSDSLDESELNDLKTIEDMELDSEDLGDEEDQEVLDINLVESIT